MGVSKGDLYQLQCLLKLDPTIRVNINYGVRLSGGVKQNARDEIHMDKWISVKVRQQWPTKGSSVR